MKYIAVLFFLVTGSASLAQSGISGTNIEKHIEYLASDSLEGRWPGTNGNELAGQYIKNSFKKNRIKPFYKDYYQSFDVTVQLDAPAAYNFVHAGNNSLLVFNKEYSIFPFSGSGVADVPVLFSSSNAILRDNEKQLKKNWIVLWRVKTTAPSTDSLSDYALATKAALNGAAGVILITPDSLDSKDVLVKLRPRKDKPLMIPVIQLKRTAWQNLKAELFPGLNEAAYDSVHLSEIPLSVSVKVEPKHVTAKNIAGVIRGNDPQLKNEYIVLGAHYDHLGYGGYGTGSLQPDTIAIHNGADDNASGTSALLEIAAELAKHKKELKRSVIVVAFSAEEEGLLGSQYFVDHLPVPDTAIRVMINMDMVGRLNKEEQLYMGGAGTFPGGVEFMKSLEEGSGLNPVVNAGGVGGSDHVSFYKKGISSIGFHTGGHPQYHTPADDAALINVTGIGKVARYIYRTVYGLANRTGEWKFIQQD